MVKKIYISPELLAVALSPKAGILQETSIPINSGETITDGGQILTKESVSDVTLWDNEW